MDLKVAIDAVSKEFVLEKGPHRLTSVTHLTIAGRARRIPRSVKPFQLDRRASVPLFRQLTGHLEAQILSGDLKPQSRMPSVRRLGRMLGIDLATVQKSYAELERFGLVKKRGRRGAFVAPVPDTTLDRERDASLRILVGQLVAHATLLGVNADELRRMLDEELARGRA